MSEWNEIRLGDLCTFISRGITPQYVDVGTPVINQKCIRNNKVDLSLCKFTDTTQKIKNEKYVEYGDILINSTGAGTLGRVAIYKHHLDSVSADGHVTILHTRGNVNSAYLGYYLHSIEPLIENLGRGSTNQMELSPTDLKRIKIVLPFLDTQKRIADILSAYDDLIENNNRRIALLEKAAQELYKEWFVRFRFPGYENAKFENGLPEGWEIKKVKNIVKRFPFGKLYKECDVMSEGTVIVIDQSKEPYIGFHNDEPSHIANIDTPIILFGDHSCKFQLMITPFSLSENVVPFTAIKDIDTTYLYFLVKDLIETTEYKRHWTELVSKKVLLADYDIQKQFSEAIKSNLLLIESLKVQNRNLIKQRDLLLPRLMSGKLEV